MIIVRPYRHCRALLFLVLYAFIATPVQWWHHHPAGHQVCAVGKNKAGKVGLWAASLLKVSTEDCQVCSYKYSTWYDDHTTPTQLAIPIFSSIEAAPLVAFSNTPRFNLFTRGPPAFPHS